MKSKKRRFFPAGQIAIRYSMLVLIFCAFGLLVLGRALWLMVGPPRDYWLEVSKNQQPKTYVIEPVRGNILAAGGEVLATTLPQYDLYYEFMSYETDSVRATREQIRKDRLFFQKIDSTALGMHDIFPDVDPGEFKQAMINARIKKVRNFKMNKKLVSYVDYCQVKELPLFRTTRAKGNGFRGEEVNKRTRPYGNLARMTVGIHDVVSGTSTGLEQYFNKQLAGTRGVKHYEKVGSQSLPVVDTAVVNGLDVQTTIDIELQDLVEKTLVDQLKKLNATIGMCVLMDVPTGDVKAITSQRRGDNGEYSEVSNQVVWERREPGSVFKPMSFMAAFEAGKIDLNSFVDVGIGQYKFGPRTMKDANWRNGGYKTSLSPVEIIKLSSNVGVSVLIDRAYHSIPEKFVEGLDSIGVRTKFNVPLRDYKGVNIRYPHVARDGKFDNWSQTTLPWMSIGYETGMCPLQTLAFYNAVANGGKMVHPRFVTGLSRDGLMVEPWPVQYVHAHRRDTMMCSKATLQKVQQCLEAVVGKGKCTGKAVYTPQFRIAGKTGTALIMGPHGHTGEYSVSFAGYFPVEAPRYSMIVVIERGGAASGGTDSGPVFKKVAETIWARDNRANLQQARDTTALAHDLPVMASGNMSSLTRVLDALKIDYMREASDHPFMQGWGRNVSQDPAQAILSSEPLMPAKDAPASMPDLKGFGVRDAVFRLETLGLKVHIAGRGRVVEQSIAPGAAYRRGQRVDLQLSTKEPSRRPTPKPAPQPSDSTAPVAPAAPVAKPTAKPGSLNG